MAPKKPFYKRWKFYMYSFVVVMLLSFILEVSGYNANQEAIKAEEAAVLAEEKAAKKAERDAEVAALIEEAEREIEKEKAESPAKKEPVSAPEVKEEKVLTDDEAQEVLQPIIDISEGVVLDIKPSPYGTGDWSTVWVVVSDAWYATPEHEQERFVESVGAAVKRAIGESSMFVHFYDSYDKELAKEKITGGYKLKR